LSIVNCYNVIVGQFSSRVLRLTSECCAVSFCTRTASISVVGTLQTTSSQPLMLLRSDVVYGLPTGTVSLFLAADSGSARLSGGPLRRLDSLELTAWWI